MPYLVAYDIADPQRLRRVARALEREAVRQQKSVFLHFGSRRRVIALLDAIRPLLDLEADVVQAWQLGRTASAEVLSLGSVLPAAPATLFADAENVTAIRPCRG